MVIIIIPMKELKCLLDDEGYNDVKAYIQSGNVVLKSSSNPSKKISELVELKFGFKPEVLALEKVKFEEAINTNPYTSTSNEGKAIHFYFCAKKPKLNTEKIEAFLSNGETYELKNKVLYLYAPNGIGRSKLVLNMESCLGVSYTGRNLNTVLKLRNLLAGL